MKNSQKSIRLNPINSKKSILINPKQSESKFSIQINPNQSELRLIQTEFSIIINPNHSDLGFIRIDSDWKFVLGQSKIDLDWKLAFGLFRIHSGWCLEIHRIKSDWFLTVFHQTRYKTFFGLVRNYSHCSLNLNQSKSTDYQWNLTDSNS